MSEHAATSEYVPVDICRAKHPDAWWIVYQLDVDHVGDHVRDCAPVEVGERLAFSQHTVRWSDPWSATRTPVSGDLWKCDECGEVIRYIDDPNGKVTLTTLHPYRNRRVRVEMVTPGTRPGNRGGGHEGRALRRAGRKSSRDPPCRRPGQQQPHGAAPLVRHARRARVGLRRWIVQCPHDTVVGWNSDGGPRTRGPAVENPCVPAGTRWP